MLRKLAKCATWLATLVAAVWAFGALHFDFPVLPGVVSVLFALGIVVALVLPRGGWRKSAAVGALCGSVLAWWLTLTPRADRDWQPDVAQLPWAEIQGDKVTLHNVRHFDCRTDTDFTPRWEKRILRLSQLTGVDMFINYWGSPWMAHPIVSFQFLDAPPLCFSIETRKEAGEKYSAIGGLYRQFELYVVAADERDVIRLRTCIRPGEESYLYRTRLAPERARERFLEYLATLNELREQPRWYNAVTTNCTTAIRGQHPAEKRLPWDWRILVNGKADSLLYERGYIETGGLPFAALREKALINPDAKAADTSPDFSRLIRAGRPGMNGVKK
jgi:hypothetical protein